MKIQLLICLCIGSALAYPAEEQPELFETKTTAVDGTSKVDGAIANQPQNSEQTEEDLSDGNKESLEPAASAWGGGFGFGRGFGGWGGYRGGWGNYGGWGNRGYGGSWYGGRPYGYGGYGWRRYGGYW